MPRRTRYHTRQSTDGTRDAASHHPRGRCRRAADPPLPRSPDRSPSPEPRAIRRSPRFAGDLAAAPRSRVRNDPLAGAHSGRGQTARTWICGRLPNRPAPREGLEVELSRLDRPGLEDPRSSPLPFRREEHEHVGGLAERRSVRESTPTGPGRGPIRAPAASRRSIIRATRATPGERRCHPSNLPDSTSTSSPSC